MAEITSTYTLVEKEEIFDETGKIKTNILPEVLEEILNGGIIIQPIDGEVITG